MYPRPGIHVQKDLFRFGTNGFIPGICIIHAGMGVNVSMVQSYPGVHVFPPERDLTVGREYIVKKTSSSSPPFGILDSVSL